MNDPLTAAGERRPDSHCASRGASKMHAVRRATQGRRCPALADVSTRHQRDEGDSRHERPDPVERLDRSPATIRETGETQATPPRRRLQRKTLVYEGFVVPRDRIELPTRGFSSKSRDSGNTRDDKWLRLLKGGV